MPGTESVARNMHELKHHGSKKRSHKQMVAIALDQARRAKAKRRGKR